MKKNELFQLLQAHIPKNYFHFFPLIYSTSIAECGIPKISAFIIFKIHLSRELGIEV